jgi:hypothetical protein
MNLVQNILKAIDEALDAGEHPVLRLWSRGSTQALVCNDVLELDASQMRLKSIPYPSLRFDVHWALLKEIYNGLAQNTVSKKR